MKTQRTMILAAGALLVLGGVLAYAAPAAMESASQKGAIRIGVINSLTGRFAAFGVPVRDGLALAVQEINAKGGRKIELVAEDDGSDPERAKQAFEKLAEAKVAAVIGPISSSATLATAPLAQRYRIPQISPIAHSSALRKAGDFTFLIFPTSEAAARETAKVALGRFKAKRVAILNPDTSFGKESTQALVGAFRGKAEVVANETFAEGQKDFSAQVRSIVAAKPNVFIYPSYYEQESVEITRQFHAQSAAARPKLAADRLAADDDIIIIIITGAACEALLQDKLLEDPALQKQLFFVNESFDTRFAGTFAKRFNSPASPYAAAAQSALAAVKNAIDKGGSVEPAVIDRTLHSSKVATAFGTVSFDQEGANVGSSFGLFQVRGQQLQPVR